MEMKYKLINALNSENGESITNIIIKCVAESEDYCPFDIGLKRTSKDCERDCYDCFIESEIL